MVDFARVEKWVLFESAHFEYPGYDLAEKPSVAARVRRGEVVVLRLDERDSLVVGLVEFGIQGRDGLLWTHCVTCA